LFTLEPKRNIFFLLFGVQLKEKKEYSLKTTLSSARNIENGNIGTSGLVKEAFTDHYNLSR